MQSNMLRFPVLVSAEHQLHGWRSKAAAVVTYESQDLPPSILARWQLTDPGLMPWNYALPIPEDKCAAGLAFM